VDGVLLRHTAPWSPAFVPGHSDLDLTILLDDASIEDPRRVAGCTEAVSTLAAGAYFFVQPHDLRFTSRAELSRLRGRFPAPPELLYRVESWAPLAGREVHAPAAPTAGDADARSAGAGPAWNPGEVVRHPEFNKWWDTMLQLQVLGDAPDLERGYARSLFRCALKCHLILDAAAGRSPDPAVLLREDLSRADFRTNPELGGILRGLAADRFWTREPQATAVRALHLCLRAAAEFFRALPAGAAGTAVRVQGQGADGEDAAADAADWSAPPRHGLGDSGGAGGAGSDDLHRAVTAELGARVARAAPELRGLRSAAAFPLPHCEPPTYRLELVVDDDLEPRDLARLAAGVRRLGGRTFDAAGAGVEVALIPETVHAHPLYREASAAPFLREHLRAWSVPLLAAGAPSRVTASAGSATRAASAPRGVGPPAPRDRASVVGWCRSWLPFHSFNLRHRPGWASRVLNFTQLASVRLRLETGEIATEAGRVRRLYLERFGASAAELTVLRRLLGNFGGGAEGPGDFARLSEEYDRLEDLVRG
jgi:hypothetical protein